MLTAPTGQNSLEAELRQAREELAGYKSLMQNELEAASAIQRSLLPVRSPLVKGLRTSWRFRPSCHLGGDSLNVFLLNERHVGFYLLDVSGHGIAASLLSVAVTHFLSPFSNFSFLREGGRALSVTMPAEVAGRLNMQFATHPEIQQFFTLVYGVINTVTHEMVYASAGHPPPVIVSAGGRSLLDSTGLPVGVDPDAEYENHCIQLRTGDRLYLYSDGVTEARAGDGEQYGEERLLERLQGSSGLSVNDALESLVQSVNDWTEPAAPDDDISLLALEIS